MAMLLILFVIVLTKAVAIKEAKREYNLITKSLFLDENYFFELLEPEDISYTYKIRAAKNFSTRLDSTYYNINLVPSEPEDACGYITNTQLVQGNIALVKRGGCSFVTKTLRAEESGATAVIISDYDKENFEILVDMIHDDTSRIVNIPAFFMLGKDGFMIASYLQRNKLKYAVINIPVNASQTSILYKQPPWTFW